jgi:cephalosporin-C deacetylase
MPLTFDLPFEELQTYQGVNPCSADFDEFWDNSIRKMQSLDPQIELQPAKFQSGAADCFHLRFSGCGGARVHAKLLRPKNAPAPRPAVRHCPSIMTGLLSFSWGYKVHEHDL